MTEETNRSARKALTTALSMELGKLELLRTKAWQILSVVVAALGVVVMIAVSARTGVLAVLVGAAGAIWFSFVRVSIERAHWHPALGWGSILAENLAPWTFYAALGIADSVSRANRDWGPVLLYTGTVTVGLLKLDPRYSFGQGVFGAALYLLCTDVLLLPWYRPGESFTVGHEVMRAGLLVGSSVVTSTVARGLSNAVGGVAAQVRSSDLFGKYRLERELASGGMGVVYVGTYCPERGFQRPVAVKLVHPHLARRRGSCALTRAAGAAAWGR
jgi:hypothetical protein